MQYGKYYCAWIDLALRDGFDGSFALRIEKRLSEEDALCRFCWSEPADLEQAARIKAERKESFLLPFSFHCRELKETALQVLRECLSEERAASIVAAAEQQLEAIGNPD